jgi:hypothetical protein
MYILYIYMYMCVCVCVDMLFYDNYNCIHIFTNYTVIVTNVQSTGESKVVLLNLKALKSDSHNQAMEGFIRQHAWILQDYGLE